MSRQRSIRFDLETDERLEQMILVSKKPLSAVIRDLVMKGEVQVLNRVGDKDIQKALVQFHDDMNANFLHTNEKLERVESMISHLGEKTEMNQRFSDLLYRIDMNLLEIKHDLAAYRQQADQGASEIVDLQR